MTEMMRGGRITQIRENLKDLSISHKSTPQILLKEDVYKSIKLFYPN
jgi:hypothetical protein